MRGKIEGAARSLRIVVLSRGGARIASAMDLGSVFLLSLQCALGPSKVRLARQSPTESGVTFAQDAETDRLLAPVFARLHMADAA